MRMAEYGGFEVECFVSGTHLPVREILLREGLEARVTYDVNLGVQLEELGDRLWMNGM